MDSYTFSVPDLPPSINKIYKVGRGGIYKSGIVGVFEEMCGYYMPRNPVAITKPCRLDIVFMFKDAGKYKVSDVDNLLKVTIDMLAHFGYVKNDNLIVEIRAKKALGDSNETSATLSVV